MKRLVSLVVAVLMVCSLTSICASADTRAQVGTDVSGFTGTLLDGTAVDGSIFSGHVINVVNYWATWCGPCTTEMPYFQACYTANGSNTGDVGIFGMLLRDSSSTVAGATSLMASNGWTYPCFVSTSVWSTVTGQYGYIPQTYFVDSNGIIVEFEGGSYSSQAELQARIDYWINQLTLPDYTVTFVDGVDGSTLKTEVVKQGSSATAPTPPTHTGYRFDAWSGSYTNVQSNITITANYIRQYNVTFVDGLDGTTIITVTVDSGGSTSLPTAPTHEGYRFKNWTGGDYTNVTSDITVTANYIRQWTVTFVDGVDGTVLLTKTVDEGGTVVPPTAPEHEGYTFTGWSGTYVSVMADSTVTAVYEANAPAVLIGDVNGDGIVSFSDISTLYAALTSDTPLSEECALAADYNGDGTVNFGDVAQLYNALMSAA